MARLDIAALGEALDAIAPQILDLTGAPGISIAVGVEDEVVLSCAYGVADLATRRPMTTETVGPTGSDCKPYTALAAMQLVEAGVVDLDEPVNDHLGGLRIVNPHGDRSITLRDLLTHRSGLGTTLGFCDLVPPPPLREHLTRVFRNKRSDAYGGSLFPLWATPVGVHAQYSNTGLALVGLLVESSNPEGATFSEWIHRHVFEPLGMTSSCFPPAQTAAHVPAELLARRSTGYASLEGMQFELPQIYIGDYPAGTALTTPSDHTRFLLAAANEGALGGVRVLRADLAREMLTPPGLVWNLFDVGTEDEYFGHGGEHMWGWHNVARAWRQHRVAVVAAANHFDLGDQGTSDRPSHQAGRMVLDVVEAWVKGHDPRPRRSDAAARSHLAGLIVADRLGMRLGTPTPLDDEQLERIASRVVIRPGTPWDRAAFIEAATTVRSTPQTLGDVADLWRREIPDHLRDLVTRQLGVPGLAKAAEGLPGL